MLADVLLEADVFNNEPFGPAAAMPRLQRVGAAGFRPIGTPCSTSRRTFVSTAAVNF
ncbi:hypothetical protein [Burkholderia ubonensis]|uniref:hypothetical protein n=1 Tax=Burkholderia ubonensis TaxID=101571 RepID=UPI0018E12EA2|nr:hypothetical protein [Burkholderia ubonensis]